MKYLVLFFSFVLIISCSSTKQAGQLKINPFSNRENLKNITLTGTIQTNLPDMNQSAEFSLSIADDDSASISIYGPLGMMIGKLYATPGYFIFLNVFTAEALEGKPTMSNLKAAINIPLEYSDFIRILTAAPAQDPASYILQPGRKDEKELYKSKQANFADFALINTSNGNIEQYQRKTADDKIIFTSVYEDYNKEQNHNLPKKIILQFPELKGSVVLEISKYDINPDFSKPFRFNIPSTVKRIKM